MRLIPNSKNHSQQEPGQPSAPLPSDPSNSAGEVAEVPTAVAKPTIDPGNLTTDQGSGDAGEALTIATPRNPPTNEASWVQDYWPYGMLLLAAIVALYMFFRSISGPSFRHTRSRSRNRRSQDQPPPSAEEPLKGQFKRTERFKSSADESESNFPDEKTTVAFQEDQTSRTRLVTGADSASQTERDSVTPAAKPNSKTDTVSGQTVDASSDSGKPLKSNIPRSHSSAATAVAIETLTSNLRPTELTMTENNPSDEFDFELEGVNQSTTDETASPAQGFGAESIDDSDQFDFEFDDSSDDLNLDSEADVAVGAVEDTADAIGREVRRQPNLDLDFDLDDNTPQPDLNLDDAPLMGESSLDFTETDIPSAEPIEAAIENAGDDFGAPSESETVEPSISAQEAVDEQAAAISQTASDLAGPAVAGIAAEAAQPRGSFLSRIFGFLKRKPDPEVPASPVETINSASSDASIASGAEDVDLGILEEAEAMPVQETIDAAPAVNHPESIEGSKPIETVPVIAQASDVLEASQNVDEFEFELEDDSDDDFDFAADLENESIESTLASDDAAVANNDSTELLDSVAQPASTDGTPLDHSPDQLALEEHSDEFDFDFEEQAEAVPALAAPAVPTEKLTSPSVAANSVDATVDATNEAASTEMATPSNEVAPFEVAGEIDDRRTESDDASDDLIASPEAVDQDENLTALQQELESVQAEKEQIEAELIEANSLLAKHEAAEEESKLLSSKKVELEAKVNALEEAVANRDTELTQVRESVDNREKEINELNEASSAREREFEEIKATVAARDADLAELKRQLAEAEERAEKAEAGAAGSLMATGLATAAGAGAVAANTSSDSDGMVQMSQEELDDLKDRFQKRLKQEHRKRKQAQSELEQAEQQRNEIASVLRATKKELVELREQRKDVPSDGSKSEALAAAQAELQTAKLELKASRVELEKVSTQLSELEAERATGATSIAKLTSEIAALKTQVEQTPAAANDTDTLAAKLAEAESNLKAVENERDAAESQLKEHLTASAKKTDQVDQLNSKVSNLEADLANAQASKREFEEQVKALQSRLAQAASFDSAQKVLFEQDSNKKNSTEKESQPNSQRDSGKQESSRADDLTKINGVGNVIARKLNELGVHSFQQIAEWSEVDVKRIEKKLSFPGRVNRDQWIQQAKGFLD